MGHQNKSRESGFLFFLAGCVKMDIIARVKTDFKEKFGIPRQSSLIKNLSGKIIFEKPYNINDAVRGLEEFSHIWILWQFSEANMESWSPTVRPPLLGGNKRVGVFATRSPFRPNSIGLSLVKLESVEYTNNGPVLNIKGADVLDNTPVYDIKPYLPYADSVSDAKAGFTESLSERKLDVVSECDAFLSLDDEVKDNLITILSNDPRPSYHNDERIYGMKFNKYEIKFFVRNKLLIITSVEKI